MSLGQKLASTQRAEKNRKAAEAKAEATAKAREAARFRRDMSTFIEGLKAKIEDAIEDGLDPSQDVRDWDHRKWIEGAIAGTASESDLWDDFVGWAKANDLKVSKHDAHDGVGINSWIELTVEPIT